MKSVKIFFLLLLCAFVWTSQAQAIVRLIPRTDSGDPTDGVIDHTKDKIWGAWGNYRDAVIQGEKLSDGTQMTSIYSCPSIKECKTKNCAPELTNSLNWQCDLIFEGTPQQLCERYTGHKKLAPVAAFIANQIFGGFLIGFVPYMKTVPAQLATKSSTANDAYKTYQAVKSTACPNSLNADSFNKLSDRSTVQLLREEEVGAVRAFLAAFMPQNHMAEADLSTPVDMKYPQKIDLDPLGPMNSLESRYVVSHLTEKQCSYYLDMTQLYNLDGDADSRYKTDLRTLLTVMKSECGIEYDPKQLPSKAQLWKIEGKEFAIFTDGKTVSFGEEALEQARQNSGGFESHTISQNDLIMALSSPRPHDKLLTKVKDRLQFINERGDLVLILSGYANHDSETYTTDKLKKLNSRAWGGGIGKEFTDDQGNIQRLAFTCFLDSHRQWECSASYDYQGKLYQNKFMTLNGGFTMGLTSRADLYNHTPIPFIFPTASVKIGKVRYNVVLIPKMGGVNSGAVLYFYASVPLK